MKILVIGQGIAGTLLTHALRSAGGDVTVADTYSPGSSSPAAAGIINPVTGKRFVKSWRLDDFFPVAKRQYQALETILGIPLWEERPIVRLLASPEESNDWSTRCAQPDYEAFISEREDAGGWSPLLRPGFRFGVINAAARVNFPQLLDAYRAFAQEQGFLWDLRVAYSDVPRYLTKFDRIVFCEGFQAFHNPYFPEQPWQLAKGEALIIRFDDPQAGQINDMLKKTSLVAPLGNGLFWAGGSYQWGYSDYLPSAAERSYILNRLGEMLAAPFKVVDHKAGVRPTVKTRRPILLESPIQKKVFIFNGLGTKGALLAPYFAELMASHLLNGMPLNLDK